MVPFNVRMWDNKLQRIEDKVLEIPIIMPHMWLWGLCHAGADQFRGTLLGRDSEGLDVGDSVAKCHSVAHLLKLENTFDTT